MFKALKVPGIFIPVFFLYLLIYSAVSQAQVSFSEIMFDPSTNEFHDEYIELYNLSADPIDLNNWTISDSLSADKIVLVESEVFNSGHTILQPEQFCVVLDGSYFNNSNTYDNLIPDSALVVKIDGSTFGQNGLTNTSPKTLFLINNDSLVISSYTYSIGNKAGYSDEKIILSGINDSTNWSDAVTFGGTPGRRNSITPFPSDLAVNVENFSWTPSLNPVVENIITFQFKLMNIGFNKFTADVDVNLFADLNNDSIFSATDLHIYRETIPLELEPQDEFTINAEYIFAEAGTYNLVLELESVFDNNLANNKILNKITVLDNATTLHINEIKFLTKDQEPEWLELFNSGLKPVNLKGWGIADQRDTSWIDSTIFINAGQYKVFAAAPGLDTLYNLQDSLIVELPGFPNFNNDADIIYLLNPLGGWLEQVPYTKNWLEGEEWSNPSLERINIVLDSRQARNWGPSTSAANATPAKANSIFSEIDKPLKSNVEISPNPFSPDADGFEDHALITVSLPVLSGRIKADIYDIMGRKIITLTDNSFSGSNTTLVWDGRDKSGLKVRMGIYIVFIQIINDREGVIKELKETVVVAGKL